jgi:hypothetical protein
MIVSVIGDGVTACEYDERHCHIKFPANSNQNHSNFESLIEMKITMCNNCHRSKDAQLH